jgi:hypothetical protein
MDGRKDEGRERGNGRVCGWMKGEREGTEGCVWVDGLIWIGLEWIA